MKADRQHAAPCSGKYMNMSPTKYIIRKNEIIPTLSVKLNFMHQLMHFYIQ